ncbi:malonyl-CoA decarboxylase [Candidatus Anaplasma sp. TIGMIC]|uniref:malonyl-CoA decarboxylase n=1 Tax=Candidatus Anaplasma sp. TIGMIC TaxID=3020713 RepID=UPI00232B3F99|nr:malonyl-CoA decarboxylase [Candidatus Anaplasma sp. TIGMIC]MDB1135089.1 malonyl-CoA decarboxylase [Candidatus Anaplasma sp. TIGMIC]
MENSLSRIKYRTLSSVARVIDEVTDVVLSWVGNISKDLSRSQDVDKLLSRMHECVNPKGGEVKARHNTISLGNLYLQLSEVGKTRFLCLLNDHFSSKREEIEDRVSRYIENTDDSLEEKLRFDLASALSSPRLSILKQFMSLEEGVKFLVDMRADVITLTRKGKSFFALERDLKNVLSSLFDVGLLELRHITWDSPASMLEKLIFYEAVHAISSWEDLRHRLDSDRRCFAFFHYKMPREPLIFVEVALVDDVADNVQELLDDSVPKKDPRDAKVAIFYSISNTQVGLVGINLGNFLIKRVVSMLSSEFDNIGTYATLSPIPGFVRWLTGILSEGDVALRDMGVIYSAETLMQYVDSINSDARCIPLVCQGLFLKLCARYLSTQSGSRVIDPVAHFHLSNGASIRRLNWMADSSQKGLSSSLGIMVNYSYEPNRIDDNYEAYVVHGKVIYSKEVAALLKNTKRREGAG